MMPVTGASSDRLRSAFISQRSSDSVPLAPPPPGVVPNFVHPDSIAWQMFVTCGICISLVLIFVALRCWATLSGSRKPSKRFTEALLMVTVVGFLCYCSLTMAIASTKVAGKYSWEILLKDFDRNFLVLSFAAATFIYPEFCLVRMCMFMLYLEIFGSLKWMKICCWIGIIFTISWSLGGTLGWIIPCAPHGRDLIKWMASASTSSCKRTQALMIAHSAVNVVMDCYLIALPLPAIWHLQMPIKRKIGVCLLFATALIGLVASVFGLYVRTFSLSSRSSPSVSNEGFRLMIPNYIVCIVEMTTAILICCAPSLMGLFRRFKDALKSAVSSTWQEAPSLSRVSTFSPIVRNSNGLKDIPSPSLPAARALTGKRSATTFASAMSGNPYSSTTTVQSDSDVVIPPLPTVSISTASVHADLEAAGCKDL